MPRGDAKQSERWAFGHPSILLPVAERVHADTERLGESGLREADEPSQRGDISRRKLTTHDAGALVSTEGTCEVVSSELGAIFHAFFSMYSA